jgi:hypothetical protein
VDCVENTVYQGGHWEIEEIFRAIKVDPKEYGHGLQQKVEEQLEEGIQSLHKRITRALALKAESAERTEREKYGVWLNEAGAVEMRDAFRLNVEKRIGKRDVWEPLWTIVASMPDTVRKVGRKAFARRIVKFSYKPHSITEEAMRAMLTCEEDVWDATA